MSQRTPASDNPSAAPRSAPGSAALLIAKEWRSALTSPRLAATLVVASTLVLLAVGLGLREHRDFTARQAAARELHADELRDVASWRELATRVFRPADPLSIFVTGVHYDVGRTSPVDPRQEPDLRHSVYSDDPLLAFFRTFDLVFVVTVVLSLFAVVFTYDAISGEREAGTLRLLLATAVPRARLVLAKLAGLGSALAVPLVVALLLGLLAVSLAGVELVGDDLVRLAVLALASALYLGFFVALGVAVSCLTRTPAASFLWLLAAWMVLVVVVPRLGHLAAVRLVPVPSAAELAAQRAGFASRSLEEHTRELDRRWAERTRSLERLAAGERDAYQEEQMWGWIEEDDESRRQVEATIAANAERLATEARHLRSRRTHLALALSRLSPASAYQLLAVELAGTGPALAERYDTALRSYRDALRDWVDAHGGDDAHRVVLRRRGDGEGPAGTDDRRDTIPLDEMPRFVPPRPTLSASLASAPVGLGLLAVANLLTVGGAVVAFRRYDVR